MERGRKLVIVSHCLLNANARVAGLADYEGAHPIAAQISSRGFGVIQLPCPELEAYGTDRAPAAIEDYDTPEFRQRCKDIVDQLVASVSAYRADGVSVELLLGVEGSPTCGVEQTNYRADDLPDGRISVRGPGSGVLMHELRRRLEPLGVRFVGIDHRDADGGFAVGVAALDRLADEGET